MDYVFLSIIWGDHQIFWGSTHVVFLILPLGLFILVGSSAVLISSTGAPGLRKLSGVPVPPLTALHICWFVYNFRSIVSKFHAFHILFSFFAIRYLCIIFYFIILIFSVVQGVITLCSPEAQHIFSLLISMQILCPALILLPIGACVSFLVVWRTHSTGNAML